ncbi:MAG: phosphate regulon transcriptional regulator PhoB [Rhodocyclaceae bacterium]
MAGEDRGDGGKTAASILVVEDEAAVRSLIAFNLARAGYRVREAVDVGQALALIREAAPELILLDWMLPGVAGIELLRRLRSDPRHRDLPIILLTARGAEGDRVRGLETGADDYVTKPFSPRELIARIGAMLRRRHPEADIRPIEIGPLRLDPVGHRVSAAGREIDLAPTEYRLLHYLMSRAEHVLTRAQLLDGVWGSGVFVDERTVDVHIRRLRAALEASGCDGLIQTVRGAGYRLSERG